MSETLPPQLVPTAILAEPTAGACAIVGQDVTCSFGDVAAGEAGADFTGKQIDDPIFGNVGSGVTRGLCFQVGRVRRVAHVAHFAFSGASLPTSS